jgi:hypothetical protein
MNTRIAVIAAVLVGTVSAAFADNSQFDVNIYRPTVVDNPLGAYAQSPASGWSYGTTGAVKPFSAEEKAMFDRAQGAAD